MSPASQLTSIYRQACTLREKMNGTHSTLRAQEEATKAYNEFVSQQRRVEWLVKFRSTERNSGAFRIISGVESGFWIFREWWTIYMLATQEVYNGISLLDISRGQRLIVRGTLRGVPEYGDNNDPYVGLNLESLSLG